MSLYWYKGPLDHGTELDKWNDIMNETITIPSDATGSKMDIEFVIYLAVDETATNWDEELWIGSHVFPADIVGAGGKDGSRGGSEEFGSYTIPSTHFVSIPLQTGDITFRYNVKRQVKGGLNSNYYHILINTR